MRASLGSAVALFLAAGCGNDPNLEFTVEVTPAAASIFSVAPENSVSLGVVAKDGSGQVVGGGTRSFVTDNAAVATVSGDGVVTAVAPGTAQITASVTIEEATESATAAVTVEEAAATATVQAPALSFNPGIVDVRAGGNVAWSIAGVHHNVDFTSAGAPADVPELQNASASRTFPASGAFPYRCTIHPTMTGTVRVH